MSLAPSFHQPSPGLTDAFRNASSTELHRDAGFHKPQANKATLCEPCPMIQVRTLNQTGPPGPLAKSHSTSTIQRARVVYSELPANDGNTERYTDHVTGLNALAPLAADTRPDNYDNEYDSELIGMVVQKHRASH